MGENNSNKTAIVVVYTIKPLQLGARLELDAGYSMLGAGAWG